MTGYNNILINELYSELERLIEEANEIRKYNLIPQGKTKEQALRDIEEEEIYIKMRIEELSILHDTFGTF